MDIFLLLWNLGFTACCPNNLDKVMCFWQLNKETEVIVKCSKGRFSQCDHNGVMIQGLA